MSSNKRQSKRFMNKPPKDSGSCRDLDYETFVYGSLILKRWKMVGYPIKLRESSNKTQEIVKSWSGKKALAMFKKQLESSKHINRRQK